VVVKPEPEPPAGEGQTAIIIGEPGSKNIRSGPGTSYGVRHIAYPGDVVSITDSAKDKGGFLWYKVYFPKSGAEGWIASQLVKTQ
jgi:serine/threonine protein kinase, bacterial